MTPPAPAYVNRLACPNLAALQDRRIFAAGRRLEAIGEARAEQPASGLVVIDVDPAIAVVGHLAQIIDAMRMIGMVVRVEHAVEPGGACIEKLLAKVGRGVDQRRGFSLGPVALDKQRAALAPVLGLGGIASAPMIADAGHAARCAAAEDGQLEAHAALCGTFCKTRGTFLNSLKKLSVVTRAISLSSTPRRAASRAATWATKAGSLVFPRIGSGAR